MKRERLPDRPLHSFAPAHTLAYKLLQHLAAMVLALAIHTVSTQVSAKARQSLLNPGVALPQQCYAICNDYIKAGYGVRLQPEATWQAGGQAFMARVLYRCPSL